MNSPVLIFLKPFIYLASMLFAITSVAAEISNGGSIAGAIDFNGDVDSHTFTGFIGQSGVISISGNVAGGEYLEIFNPDGSLLGGTRAHETVTLSQTGTYTVNASSFQASGTGNYEVHVALAPGANELGLIPNGGSIAGVIDSNGEIDSFTFDGSQAVSGVIAVSGTVGGGELFHVYNPDGTLLTTASAHANVTLPQTGTYTIVARSFQSSGTGEYIMQVALAGANEHGSIPNQGSVAESIDSHGEIDSFQFGGFEGDQGTLSVTGSVGGGEYMIIYGPDGTLLTGSASQVNLNLPQTGFYTVVVRSFQSSGTGPYTLSLTLDTTFGDVTQVPIPMWSIMLLALLLPALGVASKRHGKTI